MAIKIADALRVSLDYLVGKTSLKLDRNSLNRIEEIAKLPQKDREQIFLVIDALIRDSKAKKTYS